MELDEEFGMDVKAFIFNRIDPTFVPKLGLYQQEK